MEGSSGRFRPTDELSKRGEFPVRSKGRRYLHHPENSVTLASRL